MPRYFFHIRDGKDDPDTEGTELPDIDTAKVEASRLAAAALQEAPQAIWQGLRCTVEVADDNGTILFTVQVVALDTPVAWAPAERTSR